MRNEIRLITNDVFPEATLPDSLFAFRTPAFVSLRRGVRLEISARERLFYQAPPSREIRVSFRQGPDRVQMIGQDDVCVDLERVTRANFLGRLQEQRHACIITKQGKAAFRNDREKVAPTRQGSAAIAHVASACSRLLGLAKTLDPTYQLRPLTKPTPTPGCRPCSQKSRRAPSCPI